MLAPVLKPYKPAVDFQIVIHSTKKVCFPRLCTNYMSLIKTLIILQGRYYPSI